jgi:phosphatidate cytidylyltransferase
MWVQGTTCVGTAVTDNNRREDTLVLRLATAAAGIPLLLLLAWAGGLWLTALVVTVALLGIQELYGLGGVDRQWTQRLPGLALAAFLVLAGRELGVWAVLLVVAGLLVLLVAHRWTSASARSWLLTLAGPLYLGGALSHALLLRELDQGAAWLLLAVLTTFAVDTKAYFTGRALGRHRMAPRISPGKTWEGAVGGLVGGIGTAMVLVWVFDLPLELALAPLLGLGVAVVAQAGDLFESAIKRAAGAKEAGHLLPGHGGILDRLDSVVLALVLVYHVAKWGAV